VRITRIENQKKRPGRKNIFVDGAFLAGVSTETLIRLALRTGDEIGPDQIKILQKTEELHGARSTALRFLSTRPRTEREVRNKLREKEFGDEEITRTIDDLRRSGLLDDNAFASMYIRDTFALRPAGRLLLARKLALLGVPKSIAEKAIEEAFSKSDQADTARALAEQFVAKARSVRHNESPDRLRNRLAAYLGRRGFPWDVIQPVVHSVLRSDE
jgi:regulatory protein